MFPANLVSHLDTELRIREIADDPPALNDLQVNTPGLEVARDAAAVDASLRSITARRPSAEARTAFKSAAKRSTIHSSHVAVPQTKSAAKMRI